jgi:hypothetical protein
MSVRSAVRRGRRAAQAAFADTFAAYSPAVTTLDVNGYEVPAFTAQGSTKGKVQSRNREGDTNTRMIRVGDVDRPVIEGGLHIPLSATVPGIGWEYVCTAVGALSDVALLGRRWRVVDVPAKTYATARRLDVVEVSP